MNFLIKTEPLLQKTIGKPDYSIVAIKGSIFDLDVSLNTTNISGTFTFHFYDENFTPVYQVNVTRETIVDKIKSKLIELNLDVNIIEGKANEQADNIYKAICGGTVEQKYEAMSQFASAYGLTLLPLEEQNGKYISKEAQLLKTKQEEEEKLALQQQAAIEAQAVLNKQLEEQKKIVEVLQTPIIPNV